MTLTLREAQIKQKHEIINFIKMLILSIHLSISDEDKLESQKLLRSLDSNIKSQKEEIETINLKYGLITEIVTIGSVVHQILRDTSILTSLQHEVKLKL